MATTTTAKGQDPMPQPSKGFTLSESLAKISAQVQIVEKDQATQKWDKELSLDQAFARLEQQDTLLLLALDLLSLCEQTKEKKDVNPASDLMGRAKLTASAVKAGFKRKMKEFTESTVRQTVADTIFSDLQKMREDMKRMRARADGIQTKIKDAKTALEAQRKLHEQTAAPKIAAKKTKKQKQIEKLQAELKELEKAS